MKKMSMLSEDQRAHIVRCLAGAFPDPGQFRGMLADLKVDSLPTGSTQGMAKVLLARAEREGRVCEMFARLLIRYPSRVALNQACSYVAQSLPLWIRTYEEASESPEAASFGEIMSEFLTRAQIEALVRDSELRLPPLPADDAEIPAALFTAAAQESRGVLKLVTLVICHEVFSGEGGDSARDELRRLSGVF